MDCGTEVTEQKRKVMRLQWTFGSPVHSHYRASFEAGVQCCVADDTALTGAA